MFDKKETSESSDCKKAQRVASKFGYTILCDEDEVERAIIVAEGCESAKEVAEKYGFTVLCENEI